MATAKQRKRTKKRTLTEKDKLRASRKAVYKRTINYLYNSEEINIKNMKVSTEKNLKD